MKTAEYRKQPADSLDGTGCPWYSTDMRTIKKAAVLICIATLLALTMSCSFISDVVSTLLYVEPSVDDWSGKTETWDYPSEESPMFLVSSETQNVNIKLDGPADIFMVRMNPSKTTVPYQQSRYVVSTGF